MSALTMLVDEVPCRFPFTYKTKDEISNRSNITSRLDSKDSLLKCRFIRPMRGRRRGSRMRRLPGLMLFAHACIVSSIVVMYRVEDLYWIAAFHNSRPFLRNELTKVAL